MTQSSDGGVDPALADAIDSIRATHEDESPRGDEPGAATDAGAVSGVPASDGAESGTYSTATDARTPGERTTTEGPTPGAAATGAPTGEDHG